MKSKQKKWSSQPHLERGATKKRQKMIRPKTQEPNLEVVHKKPLVTGMTAPWSGIQRMLTIPCLLLLLTSQAWAQDIFLGDDIATGAQCHCLNNSTTLTDGQFLDTITVDSGVPGETWTVENTSTGAYSTSSPAPPAAPVSVNGATLTEVSAGVYQIIIRHVDAEGFTVDVSNGTDDLSISNLCYYPDVSFLGLPDTVCLTSNPVMLLADNGGVAGIGSFTIDGQPATVFSAQVLGEGTYEVAYTFDAFSGTPNNANDPGCITTITKDVIVPEQPNTAVIALVNVTLGMDCEAVITPDMVMSGDYPCLDDFIITVFDQNGQPIGNTVNGTHAGQRLNVMVMSEAGQFIGDGQIEISDVDAPTIICPPGNNMPSITNEVQLLNGSVPVTSPLFIPNNFACYTDAVAPMSGQHYYTLQEITVTETDVYTIELNMDLANGGIFGIYQGSFDPFQGICQGLVGVSEPLPPGEGYYTMPANDVTRLHVMLMPGMPYTLLTTAFDGNQVANYQYAFYSEGTGRINGLIGVTADIQLPLYCSSIPDLINNPASVDILGAPIVDDACMLNPPVTFTDQFINGGNCGTSTITRTFTVTDQSGNSATCTQVTEFPPITMEEVNLPPRTVNINCDATFDTNDQGNPLPDLTGYPFVITAGGTFNIDPVYCNMLASYQDLPRIMVCTGTEQFVRRWTIFDDCGVTELMQFDQLIIIGDRTGPMVSCPAPDTDMNGMPDTLVYATQGAICTAVLDVPLPIVTDDCSGWTVTTEVITVLQVPIFNPFNQIIGYTTEENVHAIIPPNGSRIVANVPVGAHYFRYIAQDDCGNSGIAECPFKVQDFALPTAACDDLIHVTLGGDGVGTLAAQFVDEGSSDNCGPVTLEVRREIDFDPADCSDVQPGFTPWDTNVDFYCCEVGDTITVELLVTDVVGNFNTCSSSVVIMDNTAPICIPPQPVIISCADLPDGADLENTDVLDGLFGAAQAIDACDGVVLSELIPQVDMQNCGLGSILRRFLVTDAAGNTNSCQQFIDITTSSNYQIKFPKDVIGDCIEPGADTLVINNLGCDDFAVNITEQRFDVVQGACFKIMRTYNVINWCEYDGFSAPVEVPRNAGCFDEGGTQDVWVIRETDGDTFLDSDSDPTNGIPFAGTRGTSCDGFSNPAGYWTTIDGNGAWTYLQVIKVIDTAPPVISMSDPGPVCTTPGSCEGTVTVDFSLTDGCAAAPPTLTVLLDEGNTGNFVQGGTTLTGSFPNYQITATLPIGSHSIRVLADDECGNDAGETVEFGVFDCQAAGIICNDNMSVVLMPQDPGIDADGDGDVDPGAIAVIADMFVNSSGEDCTGPLRYTIHRIDHIDNGTDVPFPNRPALVVTCDEVGFLPVRIYQWDSAFNPTAVQPDGTVGGPNYITCDAFLQVQDSDGLCTTSTAMGNVSGLIITEEGIPVSGVEITPRGDMMDDMIMTESDGLFEFDLHTQEDYQITPYSPEDYLNGVSTIDIILISKHILGIQQLDSPYKMVAADVNRSSTVSTLDLIHLRKAILGVSTGFPDNTSWRYIDAAYNFPNPANPWQEAFPEIVDIPMLTHDLFGADFIAMKVGDVNGNAQANAHDGDDSRAPEDNYYLRTEEREFRSGETVEALFTPADIDDAIQGFQMTLQFDPTKVEVNQIEWGLIQPEHVNESQLDRGLLTISWNTDKDYGLSQSEMTFFGIQLYAIGDGRLSESIGITSRLIKAEAYGMADEVRGLGLNFTPAEAKGDGFFLEQNRPNPFGDQTIIGFQIPDSGQVTLTIYDTNGKVVRQYQQYYAAGYNQILVDAQDVAARGLLYYKLETDQYAATKKMVILTTD